MPVARLLAACLTPFARTRGSRRALEAFRRELRAQRRHRGGRRRARAWRGKRDLRLNLGCGHDLKDGWVNVDLSNRRSDCRLDLREALPFDAGSAALVYSEHFFEHLDHPEDTGGFLAECLRVMAPGAEFHVGVPDTEWPVKAYAGGDRAYFDLVNAGMHPAWCDTRMHNLNWHFRQGGEHRYAWDAETLGRVLETAGFEDVRVRDFDPDMDREARRRGTLYMVAMKPGGRRT
jgi:predicted SAM-dependent methyltransferase